MSTDMNAFRDEVRAFVQQALPQGVRDKIRLGLEPSKAEVQAWQGALAQHRKPVEDPGRNRQRDA